jgi:RimJ/RimL family protein N-acetyltransferase
VFAEAPPEQVELPDGYALVRPRPDLVASAVRAINASLGHLRPWMAWAQEPATEEAIAAVYAEGSAMWDARRDFLYVLVDGDGEVVGGSGLHARLGLTGLEVGYWVHVDHAGRGLATEVARALTTAAFTVPGIERVRIQCSDDNARSARVPEKLGYRPVEPAAEPDGRVVQRWLVERSDWTNPVP